MSIKHLVWIFINCLTFNFVHVVAKYYFSGYIHHIGTTVFAEWPIWGDYLIRISSESFWLVSYREMKYSSEETLATCQQRSVEDGWSLVCCTNLLSSCILTAPLRKNSDKKTDLKPCKKESTPALCINKWEKKHLILSKILKYSLGWT